MATWNRSQTLLLIQLYKKHDCNPSDRKQYKNVLSSIAKELAKVRPRTTITDIQSKIKTLRNQYTREKVLVQNAPDKNYTPKLWCYVLLQFFDKFTKESEPKLEYPSKEEHNYCESNLNNNHDGVHQTEDLNSACEAIDSRIDGEFDEVAQGSRLLETTNPLEETQTIHLTNMNNKARNYAFAKFICEQLDSFEDPEILQDAKWDIQTLLHNAAQRRKS